MRQQNDLQWLFQLRKLRLKEITIAIHKVCGIVVRTMNKHLGWFDHLLAYKPGFRRYVYGLAKHVKHLYGQE